MDAGCGGWRAGNELRPWGETKGSQVLAFPVQPGLFCLFGSSQAKTEVGWCNDAPADWLPRPQRKGMLAPNSPVRKDGLRNERPYCISLLAYGVYYFFAVITFARRAHDVPSVDFHGFVHDSHKRINVKMRLFTTHPSFRDCASIVRRFAS